jgi:hypothetical protein
MEQISHSVFPGGGTFCLTALLQYGRIFPTASAATAAGAPIGQFDVKPLRHFRYTRRHGAGVFAGPETLR